MDITTTGSLLCLSQTPGGVVEVTNTDGSKIATGVTAVFTTPAGLVYNSPGASQGIFDGTVWQIGSLAPGQTATLDACYEVTDECVFPAKITWLIDQGCSDDSSDNAGERCFDPLTCKQIKSCETVTTLVDNGDGTFVYTSEDGTQTAIDINEIDMDINSVVAVGSIVTFTAEDGTVVDLDVCQIVADNCNSTLTVNADGTITHVANDGTETIVPAPIPSVVTQTVLVGNEIATHDDGTGLVVPILETVTTFVVNPDGSLTYVSEDGTITNVPTPVVTTLVDNGDNTFTYTSEDGTVTVLDLCACVTTLVDNGDGSFTYTSEDGTITTFAVNSSTVTDTVVGNPVGTHTSGDGTIVVINETITTFVLNADGSATYTSEDGTSTTIPAPVVTTLADNGDGTYTYTSEDGTTTTINVAPSVVVPIVTGQTIATHTDSNGSTVNIEESITTLVNNNDGTYTYTAEDGTTTTINVNEVDMDINSVSVTGSVVTFTAEDGTAVTVDICQIVADNCNATLVVNADGSLTHTANDGTITDVPAAGTSTVTQVVTDGNEVATHDDGTGAIVPIFETVTNCTYVNNTDGTATVSYTSEDGTIVTYCVPVCTTTTVEEVGETYQLDPACDYVEIDLSLNDTPCEEIDVDGNIISTGTGTYVIESVNNPNDVEFILSPNGKIWVKGATCDTDFTFTLTTHIECPDGTVSNTVEDVFEFVAPPLVESRVELNEPDADTGISSGNSIADVKDDGSVVPCGTTQRIVIEISDAGQANWTKLEELNGTTCANFSAFTTDGGTNSLLPYLIGATTSFDIEKENWAIANGYVYDAHTDANTNLTDLTARTDAKDIRFLTYVGGSGDVNCPIESVNSDNDDSICSILDRWGTGLQKNSQFGASVGDVNEDRFRVWKRFNQQFPPENLVDQTSVTMERLNGDHIPPINGYTVLASEEDFYQDWELNVAEDFSNFKGTATKENGLYAEMIDVWQHAPRSVTYRAVMLNTFASVTHNGCDADVTTRLTLQSLNTDDLTFDYADYDISLGGVSVASGSLNIPAFGVGNASATTDAVIVNAQQGIYTFTHRLAMIHLDGISREAIHIAEHEVNYAW